MAATSSSRCRRWHPATRIGRGRRPARGPDTRRSHRGGPSRPLPSELCPVRGRRRRAACPWRLHDAKAVRRPGTRPTALGAPACGSVPSAPPAHDVTPTAAHQRGEVVEYRFITGRSVRDRCPVRVRPRPGAAGHRSGRIRHVHHVGLRRHLGLPHRKHHTAPAVGPTGRPLRVARHLTSTRHLTSRRVA